MLRRNREGRASLGMAGAVEVKTREGLPPDSSTLHKEGGREKRCQLIGMKVTIHCPGEGRSPIARLSGLPRRVCHSRSL